MRNHMFDEIRRIRYARLRELERDLHGAFEETRRESRLSGHDIAAFRDGQWHIVFEAPPELKARNAQLCPNINDLVLPRVAGMIRQRKRAERERLASEAAAKTVALNSATGSAESPIAAAADTTGD